MFIETAILLAYIVTIVSETAIILVLQRPENPWRWIFGILLINSLTHPLVMYFLQVRDLPYVPVEFGVFLVELLWYRSTFRISWERSAVLSGVANVFSIIVGVCVRVFIL